MLGCKHWAQAGQDPSWIRKEPKHKEAGSSQAWGFLGGEHSYYPTGGGIMCMIALLSPRKPDHFKPTCAWRGQILRAQLVHSQPFSGKRPE